MNMTAQQQTKSTKMPEYLVQEYRKKPFLLGFVAGAIAVVGAGLLCVLLVAIVHLGQKRQSLATLDHLAELNYPSQTKQAEQFCTTQGYGLLKQLAAQAGTTKIFALPVVSVKSTPVTKDVEMSADTAEGHSRFFIRLVNQNGWRFHDIYFVEVNDKPVKQWASYIDQNPLFSAIERNAGDISDGVQKTAEAANSILDVLLKVKQLSNDSEPRQHRIDRW